MTFALVSLVAALLTLFGVLAHYAVPSGLADRKWLLVREALGVLCAMLGATVCAVGLHASGAMAVDVLVGVGLCWLAFCVVGFVAVVTNFLDGHRAIEAEQDAVDDLRAELDELRRRVAGGDS